MGGGSRRPGRRSLTAEERELWQRVAGTAKPLDSARRVAGRMDLGAETAAPPLVSHPVQKRSAAPVRHGESAQAPVAQPRNARAQAPHPPPQPTSGMDRRQEQRLRRGRADVDGRLDLHGMTQVHAHAALRRFLLSAQSRGERTVLVITGKGSPEGARFDTESMWGSGRGILRRLVPEWLAAPDLRPLVAGVAEAGQRHGGSGALYVRLRRRRE